MISAWEVKEIKRAKSVQRKVFITLSIIYTQEQAKHSNIQNNYPKKQKQKGFNIARCQVAGL